MKLDMTWPGSTVQPALRVIVGNRRQVLRASQQLAKREYNFGSRRRGLRKDEDKLLRYRLRPEDQFKTHVAGLAACWSVRTTTRNFFPSRATR